MRHPDNGNCQPVGGFCTAVNDPIYEALHSAYDLGGYDYSRVIRRRIDEKDPKLAADLFRCRTDT